MMSIRTYVVEKRVPFFFLIFLLVRFFFFFRSPPKLGFLDVFGLCGVVVGIFFFVFQKPSGFVEHLRRDVGDA